MSDDENSNEAQKHSTDSNEAELHAYQDALVRKGLEALRRGDVINHEEVLRRLKETGRASRD